MRNLINLKRHITSVIASMVLAVSTVGGVEANASCVDTVFTNFIAPPAVAGTYAQVDIKEKNTNSNVYVMLTSSTCSILVQIWGLPGSNWYGGENCLPNVNGNPTSAVVLNARARYEVSTDVYTKGYHYAGLKICSTSQYNSSTVSGRWNPDITGNFVTYLAY